MEASIRNGSEVKCIVCMRSEEHTSELQSRRDLVCRLLLEKKKEMIKKTRTDDDATRKTVLPGVEIFQQTLAEGVTVGNDGCMVRGFVRRDEEREESLLRQG